MKLMRLALLTIILALTLETSTANAETAAFKDVDPSFWGYEAIQWGVEQNILSGYEDGTFRPNNLVTEEEFIALLVRAYGITTNIQADLRWSYPYYEVARENNLPIQYSYNMEISRQQVANIIVGTRGVNFNGNDAIEYMLNKGLTQGKTSATIEGYKGQDTLTRAEAIAFLKAVLDKSGDVKMRARPTQQSPKFLLSDTDEFQLTNSKTLEVLEQTVKHFNEGIEAAGLDSSYKARFSKLTFNEIAFEGDPSNRVYNISRSLFVSASTPFSYNLSISTSAEAGDVNKVGALISDGAKLKEVIKSMITAFIQDPEVSEQFYSNQRISTLIDNAPNGRFSTGFVVEDGQYKASYHLLKAFGENDSGEKVHQFTSHYFEISRSTTN